MRKVKESPFASVLVLADSEGIAFIDRSALHGQGIRHVRQLSSGEEAARILAKQAKKAASQYDAPPFDLIICNAALTDMSGTEFVTLIRKHPALVAIPVILASADATRSDVLTAIRSGCSGFLLRPYTISAFEEQLELAAKALPGNIMNRLMHHANAAMQEHSEAAFEDALSTLHTVVEIARPKAEILYEEGMEKLSTGDYSGAIASFNRAVRLNVLYAEAYVGLSQAWRGKGDARQAQKYLRLAGEAYARLEQFTKARAVFQQLTKERPDIANPLLGTATSLLKQGNYTAAAKAFAESHRLTPDLDMNTQISRACHFTDKPEITAKGLCLAMERIGEEKMAERLHKRILAVPPVRTKQPDKPLLPRFPKLSELLSVASYTVRAYRQANRQASGTEGMVLAIDLPE